MMFWWVGLVALALLWWLGPRPRVVLEWLAEELPVDIERLTDWLNDSEAGFEVTPGAEKHIDYANPQQPRQTEYVVLYLHGFSATRQELSPIPERLAERLGANYYGARLSGHGEDGERLGDVSAGDWLRDTAEAWQVACQLGRRVIILSCSTGGTLATWLAEQPSAQERLAALVLVSPNFQMRHWATRLFGWPWSRYWVRFLSGSHRVIEAENEGAAKYWTHHYPMKVLHELQALVQAVRSSEVEAIRTPTLFIYSPDDQVVNSRRTERIYQRWGGDRERIRVPGIAGQSNHVIAGDLLAPQNTERTFEQIVAFLEKRGVS